MVSDQFVGWVVAFACLLIAAGGIARCLQLFVVYRKGRELMAPFTVEIHAGATYLRKRNGQLRKIADHPYGPEELRRLEILNRQVREEERARERARRARCRAREAAKAAVAAEGAAER